jgi:hypothetical protein
MNSKQQTQSGPDGPGRRTGRALPDVERLVDDATKMVADGAHVAVGFGVLGFQRAQVERRRLRKAASSVLPPRLDEAGRALSANADATRAQLQQLARDLDHNLAPVRNELERRASSLGQRLPSPAREAAAGLRNRMRGSSGPE